MVEKVADIGQRRNHNELFGLTASDTEKEASGKHASVGIGQSTTHLAYWRYLVRLISAPSPKTQLTDKQGSGHDKYWPSAIDL